MKILQLCLSSSLGGLELYFLENTLYLHQHTENQVVALVQSGSSLHTKMLEHQVTHYTWHEQTGKFPIVSALKIKKLLRETDFDIVHIHCKKDLPVAAWLKTFSSNAFKLVHTRQMNMPGSKKSMYHNFMYDKVDKLLSITQKLHEDMLKRVKIHPAKVETLYYGVKIPQQFSPTEFQQWTSQFESEPVRFRLAVFGNLNATKAQHNILDALGQIKDVLSNDWKLYLVGKFIDESYKKVIEERIRGNGLEKHVVVTGFVENAKRWMPGFDLIVLTTLGETFGLVLVEAMKSGVAVIGTNSEGVPEIIDHLQTGILVEPNDTKQLADAILELYQDERLRKALAAAGKHKAERTFDYEQHFERLMAIYKELNDKD